MKNSFNPDWRKTGKRIVLASDSPRRSEILTAMGMCFTTHTPLLDNEASFLASAEIEGSLTRLARAKARSVAEKFPDALILGADTIVVCEGTILGKPHDRDEAYAMLQRLSGRSHLVYTGVALLCLEQNFAESTVVKTKVFFRDVTDLEISMYIGSDECADKAGAYAIQGKAMVFVDKIEGCYYNVVGLPVVKTIALFNAYSTRKESQNV